MKRAPSAVSSPGPPLALLTARPSGNILSPMPAQSLNRIVANALRRAPCSLRALARTAGVSHAQLARLVGGQRNATPPVAEALASALEQWGADCVSAAKSIRKALAQPKRGGHRGKR